jgi:hypothetical protein
MSPKLQAVLTENTLLLVNHLPILLKTAQHFAQVAAVLGGVSAGD